MATFKYTAKRGSPAEKDVIIAAGSAEAQTETISLNIDRTAATKGDVLMMLEAITKKIMKEKWPPL